MAASISLSRLTLGAAALVTSAAALTVRVEAPQGAPRITLDGKPVRGRMFWGAPDRSPLPVALGASTVSFEFAAIESEPLKATMHFRFGQTPGEIVLDDIRVQDLDAGQDVFPVADFESGPDAFTKDWTFWPTGDQNTVATVAVEPGAGRDGSAGLRIKLAPPANRRWPDWHIYHLPNLALARGHRYRVSFWIRTDVARDLAVAFYRPAANFVLLGGPPGRFESQIRLAAEAGIDFVSFPVPCPWPAPDQPVDWDGVDAACQLVLNHNPRALLLPRFGMDPPTWWREANPGEIMVWEDGSHPHGAVVASPRYRHDAAERLTALVTHLEATFGDHVAGYHPCGQNTGEWFYHDTWGRPLNGYAPADLTAWRRWLSTRYATDDALRAAWGRADATLDTAEVPTAAARHAAPAGVFRDPAQERPLLDFAEFQQEAMAECVCELARAARQASGGRKLVTFFYGYVFEFGAIHNGAATSGHYGLRRVLNCQDIDVLCSPISYFDRGLAESGPVMAAGESVALTGKLWLCEDDTATHLSSGTFPGHLERVSNLAETHALLARNLAHEATRNQACWWMDLGASGWFNDAAIWAEMTRFRALDEALLRSPQPFRPEVAAILDERSILFIAAGGVSVTRPAVYEVRRALGRMGTPYGQYLLDDVIAGRVGAKLCVFVNAWSLSAAQRRDLLTATRTATRIWCYAPGYFDEYQTSPEASRELTGFALGPVTPDKAWATPSDAGRKLGLLQGFGLDKPLRPLLAARDATGDEVLATYPDGSAAVAWRQQGQGVSLFVGPPGLTSELLRVAARRAAVHLFAETDANVYANGDWVAVHAAADGPLPLDLGRPGPVAEVGTGALLGTGPKLVLPLKRGETRVLRIEPGGAR